MTLNKDLDELTCIIRNIKLNCIINQQKKEETYNLNITNQIVNKLDEIELKINDLKNLYLLIDKEM